METNETAQLFKALGDENRLKILERIAAQDEVCACNLLEDLEVSQPTLSHHMKLLRDCGLVDARKEGRWMHYSINKQRFEKALSVIETIIHKPKE